MLYLVQQVAQMRQKKKGEYMVNVSKLKGKIVERNTTQEELATKIGIDKSTFYRKMKHDGNFSIKEVNLIVATLNLSKDEAMAIFWRNSRINATKGGLNENSNSKDVEGTSKRLHFYICKRRIFVVFLFL